MEKKQSELKIDKNAGEVLCDICEGEGYIRCKTKSSTGILSGDTVIPTKEAVKAYVDPPPCWKCQGSGKLDWISYITGNPKKPNHYGSSVF